MLAKVKNMKVDTEKFRPLGRATGWIGFISGILSMIVSLFLMPSLGPRILMFEDQFTADFNQYPWRLAMFSFIPDVFMDVWTPFIMGMISIMCHFRVFHFDWMCRSYGRFLFWNLALGLFGQIGYCGIVGIIASAFSFLCSLLSLICVFTLKNESAKLNLGDEM